MLEIWKMGWDNLITLIWIYMLNLINMVRLDFKLAILLFTCIRFLLQTSMLCPDAIFLPLLSSPSCRNVIFTFAISYEWTLVVLVIFLWTQISERVIQNNLNLLWLMSEILDSTLFFTTGALIFIEKSKPNIKIITMQKEIWKKGLLYRNLHNGQWALLGHRDDISFD